MQTEQVERQSVTGAGGHGGDGGAQCSCGFAVLGETVQDLVYEAIARHSDDGIVRVEGQGARDLLCVLRMGGNYRRISVFSARSMKVE